MMKDSIDATHKAGTPLRFEIGTRVEVRWCGPGGMMMIGTAEGGEWRSATILEHDHRQDHWCPGFVCAYSVLVDGDVRDGYQILSPVREDDDRCIRLLLESGAAVIIDGLKSREDLNGQRGTIEKFLEPVGKFSVKLSDGGEKLAVKRENLLHDVENTSVDCFGGLLKMSQKNLNPAKYYGIDPERLRM